MDYVCVRWSGKGFGDVMLTSLLVHTLRDNDVRCILGNNGAVFKELLDCAFCRSSRHKNHSVILKGFRTYNIKLANNQTILGTRLGILRQGFKDLTGSTFGKNLKVTRSYIPVRYYDISSIPSFDVVMGTVTGVWTPYRNWPYFSELKHMFREDGISYIDLDEHSVYGVECLNFVNKAKLYLGLETGRSHYVSKYANGKALILQGGYTLFKQWAWMYDYNHIGMELDCAPCWLIRNERCKFGWKCMIDLKPELVFDKIKEML